jgi:hypothetical protein
MQAQPAQDRRRFNLHRTQAGSTCTGHKQDQPAQDTSRFNLHRTQAGSTCSGQTPAQPAQKRRRLNLLTCIKTQRAPNNGSRLNLQRTDVPIHTGQKKTQPVQDKRRVNFPKDTRDLTRMVSVSTVQDNI